MTQLFTPSALLPEGWRSNVLLELGRDGRLTSVEADSSKPPGATLLSGPTLPGMPNVHCHAFQRALAGLSERRVSGQDDFWSWRQTMYGFVSRLTPEDLRAVAGQVYVEMLKAGYTAVAEFHYVHHRPDGGAYDDPAEMSHQVVHAARKTGIGLLHLPVFYAYGGFGAVEPDEGQRRFVHNVDSYLELLHGLLSHYQKTPGVRIGIAPHSLRATSAQSLGAIIEDLWSQDREGRVHIHVAEQEQEVNACVEWSGRRPVAWLLDHAPVDERWVLVHATHVTPSEMEAIAASGAVVGLCPTTEANLGDGIFPAEAYLAAGGAAGIGSDSNVSVSWVEELRTLEYGQRLKALRRAVLSGKQTQSVGRTLYDWCHGGGVQALGLSTATPANTASGIAPGQEADLVVLDPHIPTLIGLNHDTLLDAAIFSGNLNPVKDVMVGGQWRIIDGHHPEQEAIYNRYQAVLLKLAKNL